jgi:hypothetical protein
LQLIDKHPKMPRATLAISRAKVYDSGMIYVLSGGFAIVAVAGQALLTRAVARAASGMVRGVLLSIKFPLWAGFFIALAAAGRGALLLGGATAIAGYLALALWWMTRLQR